MEDESSNDVITMEIGEYQSSSGSVAIVEQNNVADRPLMQFFKRLISNKHLQNTVLTNAQLEDILNKEFHFDLSSLHTLEVEIYVTILKKYLKEWPMWDDFETTTKDLTGNNDSDAFINILEKRYNSLKTYLKTNLDMAKELSAELVTKVKNSEKSKLKELSGAENPKLSDSTDVVLEIQSTREQLNKLIYRQPQMGFNNTMFNVEDKITPSHIRLNTLSLEAILNWWSVKITISLQTNSVFLSRETTHELKHLLVNRKRREETPPVVTLNGQLQIKEVKKINQVPMKQIMGCLNLLSTNHTARMEGMETIILCLKKTLKQMHTVGGPAHYRRYLSKHPYVRYLYSEPDTATLNKDKADYDIQLKETLSPMHHFFVGRLDISLENALPPQWLKVECMMCNITFSGEKLATELKQHFDEYHQAEPVWQCTNCNKSFQMAVLAENWWRHKCNT